MVEWLPKESARGSTGDGKSDTWEGDEPHRKRNSLSKTQWVETDWKSSTVHNHSGAGGKTSGRQNKVLRIGAK